MSERPRIIVNGALGRMGLLAVRTLEAAPDLTYAGGFGRGDDLAKAIKATKANIVIDFTLPDAVFDNSLCIIKAGVHPIIGTSGLSLSQVEQLQHEAEAHKLGGIIAPNFALSALLMMRFAQEAARHFDAAAITERHHPHKLDAPSGTARRTAQMIQTAWHARGHATALTHDDAARGDTREGVAIHAQRLPHCFAEQDVVFSDPTQSLTLSSRCTQREACAPGILMACRRVAHLDRLVYGLETLLAP
jgi:4-hydroxy-tetrahydrodipicolinate reductase